jgi:hypothetical protein
MKAKFLHSCQIETPAYIIDGMWRIAGTLKTKFKNVLDAGAGDGRFARSQLYDSYVGYEVDSSRIPTQPLPANVDIINKDAFSNLEPEFDLCIGNPPYIRANRLDPDWRERVALKLEMDTGITFMRNANLFIYFITLALLRTKADGLVIQLVPFEWVSRPSAKPLRNYIIQNGWRVSVYRFNEDIFDNVLTTASITVIDKSQTDGRWRYYQLSKNFDAAEILQPSGSKHKVLDYSERHELAHALRGLSPGGQDIFTLNEHDRLFYGLEIGPDVSPCITSLRHIPSNLTDLTKESFKQHYVDTGQKCWLIRSDQEIISENLKAYIDSINEETWGKYTTCTNRKNWWQFRIHPIAPLLIASGFCKFGPKILKNSINAVAVGSVFSITSEKTEYVRVLEQALREKNFEAQVVSHSNNLKKIEIRQLNSVISTIIENHERKERVTNVANRTLKSQCK